MNSKTKRNLLILCLSLVMAFVPFISTAQTPIEEDVASFVLTNEGNDKMINRLEAAGCTNLYQALKYLRADLAKNPNAPSHLTSQMDALIVSLDTHAGSEVFTASLHDFTGVGDDANSPVGINADGTFIRNAFSTYDYDGHTGYTRYTIDAVSTAIGSELYTYSNNSSYDIYMGSNDIDLGGGITKTLNYKAFAIAWSVEAPTTFILSNEERGLIDELIAGGYGNGSLYDLLVNLQVTSGVVISDIFLETLANCPAGSEIFTAKLRDYAGIGNAVGINTDGTLKILDIKGRDYYGKTGYGTYPEQSGGVGRELFTYATSAPYYIDAGDKPGGGRYKAFAIGWSGSSTLSVSPSALNVEAAGGTASFDVVASISWTVSSDQSWLTINPGSGTGNGSVTVTAEENTGATARTATVTISATGVTSQTVTVTQTTAIHSGGDGGGRCFIATAAFGTPAEKHVSILRAFRDRCLLTSAAGKAFVKFYYDVSPPLAAVIAEHEALRFVTRCGLMPFVGAAYLMVHYGAMNLLLGMLLLLLTMGALVWMIRRKVKRIVQ